MPKNKYIQLSLFDYLEDQDRKRVLFEIDQVMGRNIDTFAFVPRNIEKLEYIRDFLKAYKKGGLTQVKSEGLEVGGPKYSFTEKHESVLYELLSGLGAQLHRGTSRAEPRNHKKA